MKNWTILAVVATVAVVAQAESVEIANHSFEANQARLQLVDRSWTGNVEGWNSDAVATDSGVDVAGSALVTTVMDGRTYAFIRSADPEVWQTTGHAIAYGELFTLTFDAYNCWGGPALVGRLYYVDSAGARVILASTTVSGMNGGVAYAGRLTYLATGANSELGRPIGVLFDNPSEEKYSYSAFDNVHLDLLNGRGAIHPSPADKAVEVACRDIQLGWRPGLDSLQHDIYLGTRLEDVNNATATADPAGVYLGRQDANALAVSPLRAGQAYYWRVDEISADGTLTKGAVWQFTTEAKSYAIATTLVSATASSSQAGCGPENTVNGSGLNAQDGHATSSAGMWQSAAGATEPVWIQFAFDRVYKLHEMWVWNYNNDIEWLVGFGLKEVAIDCSLDGAAWTPLGTFTFARATSKAGYAANTKIDFAGAAARHVRLTVKSSWGSSGRYGLSEVRFFHIPTYARMPDPAAGATGVHPDAVLSWRSGRDAASHEVYLSTDQQSVAAGTALAATVSVSRYAPALELSRTYYWKVNEVNVAAPITLWEGDVWQFTTREFNPVEDFEAYNDDEKTGLVIWQNWVDGYGTTTNGCQVGHGSTPYAERTIVHEGTQSMPFYYGNQGAKTLSEAVRTFTPAQDWTPGGAKLFVLYFQGVQTNTTGRLYVKINGATVVYSGPSSDLAQGSWITWAIDLSTVPTDLTKVSTLAIGVDNGGSGTLYFDDLRLCRVAPQ